MKTSTKIWILITIIMAIPSAFLARYFFEAIVPTADGFTFNFTGLSWVGLAFIILSTIAFNVLYIIFLKSLKLSSLLFFSILPLTLFYGSFIVYISQLNGLSDVTSEAVKATLNLSVTGTYNNLLWIILATIIYLLLVLAVVLIACKPLRKVEHATEKLGDGRAKSDKFKIGGSKQFQGIEDSLNKINYIYKENENKLRITKLDGQKSISKQFLKFLGKENIKDFEMGREIKKRACILYCRLNHFTSKELTLEETFNYTSSYIKTVTPLISRHNGFVDKYLEEGVIAVFSKPQNAIECANMIFKTLKGSEIEIRVVLHTSEVVFGLVGEEGSKVPAIISGIENLLTKIDEINKFIGSKYTFTKEVLSDLPEAMAFDYRYIGLVNFENKNYSLYESLEYYKKDMREKLKKYKNIFESGVHMFNEKRYDDAKVAFQNILKVIPSDKPSFVYFNKSNEKINNSD